MLIPFVAIVLFGLSVVNSEIVALPKQIQRGLTFIPGKWDVDMARMPLPPSTFDNGSGPSGGRIIFLEHPFLGRGFGFRSPWATTSVVAAHSAWETTQVVEAGNIHNGLFSALDAFGIVGIICFAHLESSAARPDLPRAAKWERFKLFRSCVFSRSTWRSRSYPIGMAL